MANNAAYSMKAVSDRPEALERLGNIMKYTDREYHIYRVFSAGMDDVEDMGNGLYTRIFYGDVAWGINPWVTDRDDPAYVDKDTGSTYHSLRSICRDLGIAVEIWCEEYGVGQQEHGLIDREGGAEYECRDAEYVEEEDRTDVDIDWSGGFDDYCDYMNGADLWVSRFPKRD